MSLPPCTIAVAMDLFTIGYIMGLVVGEGSFTGDARTPTLSIKLHRDDPQPLVLVNRALGGRIYGPYEHTGRRFWLYHLRGVALERSIMLFDEYLPRSKKRRQFLEWARFYGFSTWGQEVPSRPVAAEDASLSPLAREFFPSNRGPWVRPGPSSG